MFSLEDESAFKTGIFWALIDSYLDIVNLRNMTVADRIGLETIHFLLSRPRTMVHVHSGRNIVHRLLSYEQNT